MRKYFFEILSVLVFGSSLIFFYQCIRFLARRDYVASVLLTLIGFAIIRAGAEVARLAMIERKR